MTEVIIAGLGQTTVGEHWDIGLRDLAFYAMSAAIKDAAGLRPQSLFVGNMLAPNLSKQAHLGALLADYAGLAGIEAVTIEAAGASGGAALRQGYLAIKSGLVDTALVVGVEKFTDVVGAGVEEALATTSDSDFEAVQGMTPTAQAALIMKRYMHEFNVPVDGFAGFALTAHANGAGNPNAMFQKAIKPETYAKAGMVSEPVNMFDAAPNADGAAALVLTSPRPASGKLATSHSSRSLVPPPRPTPWHCTTARICSTSMPPQLSAGKAMKQANLTLDQIHLFEYP